MYLINFYYTIPVDEFRDFFSILDKLDNLYSKTPVRKNGGSVYKYQSLFFIVGNNLLDLS